MAEVAWQWRTFDQLSTDELYELLKLRQDIFILEQQCLYNDLDDQDQISVHLQGRVNDKLVAYLRVYPKTIDNEECMIIGRVLTDASQRGAGTGRGMMQQTMAFLAERFPDKTVQLSAQQYLTEFYASFGFEAISEPYDEDGIMHLDMRLVNV